MPEVEKVPVTWIASYPRSGNTFMRVLLANYLLSEATPFAINELAEFCPTDTSRGMWHAAGIDQAALTDENWWKRRSDVLETYRRSKASPQFLPVKTHTGNYAMFGQAGFNFQAQDKIIYIVRHPLDVVVSYADYNDIEIDLAIDIMCQSMSFAKDDITGERELRGSWSENVASWIFHPPCPLIIVRYKDLADNTAGTLADVLTFLGMTVDPVRLIRAVHFSSFKLLQEQESATPFVETMTKPASGRFFRVGRCRQWLKSLSSDQAYRLADACEDVMERLGFVYPKHVYFDGRNTYGEIDLVGRP
jgi:hypothetical protein